MANEKPGETLRLDIDSGKYTLIIGEHGESYALRYNEPWITERVFDVPGANMFSSIAFELDEARKTIADLQKKVSALKTALSDAGWMLAAGR